MLQQKIACHTFLCLSQPRPLWKWILKTQDMPKQLVLFNVYLPTVTLYIKWDQFLIVHVALTTPSHQVPSKFMLVFKRLRLNPFETMTFLTLKVVLGDNPTRLKTIQTIFKSKLSNSTLKDIEILLSQLSVCYQKKSLSTYSSALWL